jgi:hypothetical protein
MTFVKGGKQHGAFVPEGMRWTSVDGEYNITLGDHHRVWLLFPIPGGKRRRHVLVGELRRHAPAKSSPSSTSAWRAFPAGAGMEFPEVFSSHYKAMEYLKQRWEAKVPLEASLPTAGKKYVPPVLSAEDGEEEEKPPVWTDFFGQDLWDEMR